MEMNFLFVHSESSIRGSEFSEFSSAAKLKELKFRQNIFRKRIQCEHFIYKENQNIYLFF